MKTATSQIAFVETRPERVFRNGSIVPAISETGTCYGRGLTGFIATADSKTMAGIAGSAGLLYALISGILNLLLLIS